MTRKKKKLTCQELEEYVLFWTTERLEEVRKLTQTIYNDISIDDQEKEFIYHTMADQVCDLVDLMWPLEHDEEHLMTWAHEFIDEYALYDKDSLTS